MCESLALDKNMHQILGSTTQWEASRVSWLFSLSVIQLVICLSESMVTYSQVVMNTSSRKKSANLVVSYNNSVGPWPLHVLNMETTSKRMKKALVFFPFLH